MNCEGWRLQIVATLDRSGDPKLASQLESHLENCPSCMAFYQEQSELTALFSSPRLELTPPEHLWYRIEDRLPKTVPAAGPDNSRLARLFGFWQLPALRYATAGLLLLLAASASLLDLGNRARTDQVLLARLDAYQVRVEGNPFLAQPVKANADNPFFSIETSVGNPFQAKGSLK